MKTLPPLMLKNPRHCSQAELSLCQLRIAAARKSLPPAAKKVRLPHGEVVTAARAATFLDQVDATYTAEIRRRVAAN